MITYGHRFSGRVPGSLLFSASLVRAQIPSSIDSYTCADNPKAAAPQWLKKKETKTPERIQGGYNMN